MTRVTIIVCCVPLLLKLIDNSRIFSSWPHEMRSFELCKWESAQWLGGLINHVLNGGFESASLLHCIVFYAWYFALVNFLRIKLGFAAIILLEMKASGRQYCYIYCQLLGCSLPCRSPVMCIIVADAEMF